LQKCPKGCDIRMAGSDERIDKLGDYFVYFNIRERFEITFERFVQLVDSGQWSLYQGV
jgi:hypothetical protein